MRRYSVRIAYEVEFDAEDAQAALEYGRKLAARKRLGKARVVAATGAHICEIPASVSPAAGSSGRENT